MFKNKKIQLYLFLIIVLGVFLRFYKIQDNLIFNGEMGYDYTTIKNFVDAKKLPLIGPRTSHEWFYIGPIFYWMFGILLPLFKYNVFVGAYFFAAIGVLSIVCVYYYLSKMFNKSVGLVCAFLISFSPLWVALSRDARYNALTAILFVPFYYYLTKSTKDGGKSLFKVGILLGVMFSFFPSPILLLPGAIIALFLFRKEIVMKNIWFGILGILLPNLTYIYYNFAHGFEILKNLISWIPYRILGFVGLYPKNTVSTNVLKDNVIGLYTFFQTSFLTDSNILTILIFLILIIYFLSVFKKNIELKILFVLFVVSYLGLFLHGSPPIHYYLVMYPVPIIIFSHLISNIKGNKLIVFTLVLFTLFVMNLNYYFSDKWFYVNSTKVSGDLNFVPYGLQLKVADFIYKDSNGQAFYLKRVGKLDYFDNNFSLNYQYLLKNLGAKLNPNSKIGYTIYEDTSQMPASKSTTWLENLAIIKNEL